MVKNATAIVTVCLALSALTPGGALHAQRQLRVKLATAVPTGSSYEKSLRVMGQKWKDAPGGGVRLIIYAGGIMGGESTMVDKMQVGQLQAAMLTVSGLSDIVPDVTALQNMPMMFRSLEEVDYIREKLRPELETQFLEKGYVVLFWGDAGWVRFFAREPVIHPEDLKKLKLFTWVSDNSQVEIMRAAGFRPVALEIENILIQLKTGGIDAVPTVPFYALAGQFYDEAPHMLELNWAPMVGGTVITKKTWDKFLPETRDAMREAARVAGEEIKKRSRAESEESVAAMKKRGLQVHPVTPEVEAEWREVAEQVYPKIRGRMVPADMFDKVRSLLEEYRASR